MPVHPDDALWTTRPSPVGLVAKTSGLVFFTASFFATLIAWGGYDVQCLNYEGAEACLGRPTEWALYLLLSVAGLAGAGATLHFAFRGPKRVFAGFLVLSLLVYLVSVVFADAGTHGWDNLKLVP